MAFPTNPSDGQEYRKWLYDASVGAWLKKGDIPIGFAITEAGPVKSPSKDFPYACITNFDTYTDFSNTDWPYLVMKLREVYWEHNDTSSFSGTSGTDQFTLDSNTTNDQVIAALAEMQSAYDSYGVLPIVSDGNDEFNITDLDTVTRVISLDGTPSGSSITLYTHRVVGDSTLARHMSFRGRTLVGANGEEGETIAGAVRRDQFQGHSHLIAQNIYPLDDNNVNNNPTQIRTPGVSGSPAGGDSGPRARDAEEYFEGPPRIGSTTHSHDVSVHAYIYGGPYRG